MLSRFRLCGLGIKLLDSQECSALIPVSWSEAGFYCHFAPTNSFKGALFFRHPFGYEAAGRERAVVNTACDYFN